MEDIILQFDNIFPREEKSLAHVNRAKRRPLPVVGHKMGRVSE